MDLGAGVLSDEGNTLVDVLLEVSQAGLEHLLLVGVNLADGQDLLNTVGAELDLGGEEVNALVLVQRGVNESGLNDTLLALSGAQERLSHAGTGHGHGEGGRASTVLGLDDLVTTELDTVDELLVGGQVGVLRLAEEGHNGDTRVATNNGDVLVGGVGTLELGDEARGTDDVEGGNTEEALGVVDTAGLEDLGNDGDGGVDGVGDDEDVGLRAGLGAGLGQVADDGGVGVEQIVTGHAGLAGDTGGDEDNLGALEGGGQAGGGRVEALDGGLGVDVGNVGGNTCMIGGVGVSLNATLGVWLLLLELPEERLKASLPGAMRISYRASSVTLGFNLSSRERGWPIPPAAPRTVTLDSCSNKKRAHRTLALDPNWSK